ncbi:HTH-type transcriptional regulator CueR [Pelagimonas phthalicica]|uniref:HTH-type transcriptional regulator CueR n=1 Tax=Pelagimonas phthalicica TaxID=1037362 RepID=A0A238J8A9_9RHOB|nr:MerR family transcriptional regulator [Pelagimonas phthalicica]TDS94846.1 DNA-binding transcriptional MerR regulator [Pelagimonas phthalicica]SMX26625.1 HTH-type transcriptional regulator CueR [Pelagimonas phthalicica]
MRIGELSRLTGVSTDTLRLYEKRGLIRSERHTNGYRDFDPAMARVVHLIKTGQSLGFKLREMEDLACAMSDQGLSATEVTGLLTEKLCEVDQKIEEMHRLRDMLATMAATACPLSTKG